MANLIPFPPPPPPQSQDHHLHQPERPRPLPPSAGPTAAAAATLLVRHLPEAIPEDMIARLFTHFGAFSVRPWAGGKMLLAFSIAKEEATKLGTVIGIDLRITYSCVGVYKNGHVEIIVSDQGNFITPSWVAFTDSERLIGEAAKNQVAVNAERTIFDVKRLNRKKHWQC